MGETRKYHIECGNQKGSRKIIAACSLSPEPPRSKSSDVTAYPRITTKPREVKRAGCWDKEGAREK